MTTTNTGGPAFPRPAVFTQTHGLASPEQDGMTLRDYFAAKAMQSYWADPDVADDLITAAAWAYDMADAMLKARNA